MEERRCCMNFLETCKLPEGIRIPYFGGKLYSFLSNKEMNYITNIKISSNLLNKENRNKKIILSLTSFPDRIEKVEFAIKSLMLQTYKPDRIVLWLAEEQFQKLNLPATLRELEKFGLEIYYCVDVRGHKKYLNLIKNQKEDELIVTYDDDIIYPPNSLEKLIKTHNKFPNAVVCNRGQTAERELSGDFINPGRWRIISNEGVHSLSFKVMPSSGGGCLYPYNSLFKDACDIDKIKEYALSGDDLWIMFMCLENDTKIVKTCKYHKTFSVIDDTQKSQLAFENIISGNYINILKKLKKAYPKAYNNLTNY